MILKLHKPGSPLSHFIDHFVFYSGYQPEHTKEKILPRAAMDVIIDLTESPKKLYDNENHARFTTCKKGWVSGMHHGFLTIGAEKESAMLVIHFLPGSSYPFFPFPLDKLTDHVIALDQVWGNSFYQLREQLLECHTPEKKFEILEKFLIVQARKNLEKNPCIDFAVKFLSQPFAGTVKLLIEKIGYSHRHFLNLFTAHVGLTPKYFARIQKFQRVIHAIEQRQAIQWAHLAQECGYYDQAHFIHEFKRFSGFNPAAYLTAKGEYLNFVPLD